jgi:hypothetical protein
MDTAADLGDNFLIEDGGTDGSGTNAGDDICLEKDLQVVSAAESLAGDPVNYFGDGSDGALTTSGSVTHTSIEDGDAIQMNYTDLTISAGHTMTVNNRNKGLFIYVSGNCVINGTLSMSSKGAIASGAVSGFNKNTQPVTSSGWSSETTNQTGEYSFASFDIGAVGGIALGINDPGAGVSKASIGANGSAGANGACGGGGQGGAGTWSNGTNHSRGGGGSAGTSFSGGAGGAGSTCQSGQNTGGSGVSNGGAGGAASSSAAAGGCIGGGAGNPGGAGVNSGTTGSSGTGGLIVLIVAGNLTIGASGVISSDGTVGGSGAAAAAGSGGGGSGGGALAICYAGALSNSGTIQANGGAGGASGTGTAVGRAGGDGGAGSIQGPTRIVGAT